MSQKDLLLLQRVQSGDRSAIAELYDGFASMLYGVIRGVVSKEDDAEKLLGEVFTHIWNNAGTYDACKGSPCFWMLGIARKAALAHEADRGTIGTSRQALERQAAVDELLRTASPGALFALAYFNGWTRQCIADHLGVTEEVARSRMRAEFMTMRGGSSVRD